MAKPKNYVDMIHNEAYLEPFQEKLITSETLINDFGRKIELLNGRWSFTIDPYDTCLRGKWWQEEDRDSRGAYVPVDYNFTDWELTPVPSCINLQKPEYFWYEGPAVYTREFHYYEEEGFERIYLKVGAVNYEALIFINRQFVGRHLGGSTPMFVDVTDYLNKELGNETNRILIVTNNDRKPTQVPMHNTDWFNYGGLYRDIGLIRLPKTFIDDTFVGLQKGSDFKKIDVKVSVNGPEQNGAALLEIPELGIRQEIEIKDGAGSIIIDAEPELWDFDNPKLYDVVVSYATDVLTEKIGFREIATSDTDILLNGKSIKLKGISSHEESAVGGKTMTEAEIRENFALAKEMNANYMRLAHYPHTEKAARIADEVGMLLWEEIPVYWSIAFTNPDTYSDAENQLCEMIKRDKNRASVIMWSVGNENADTDERLVFMRNLAEKAREMDPSRLISAACLWNKDELRIEDRLADHLDVMGINEYFGWYNPHFDDLVTLFENSRSDKPVVITECGADAPSGEHGTKDQMWTEEYQENVYIQQVETMRKIKYMAGFSPWILYDFRCPRRTNRYQQSFYNRKGLLNPEKTQKKLAFKVLQDFYEEWE
jgi:beta-glucuronidase